MRAAESFFVQGFAHVARGLDHLLFVLCLALGTATLAGLIGRVTAFTLGHALSLGLGFFGYLPREVWFVPAIETAIAASIVLAAGSLLVGVMGARALTILTVVVGLVHGLGFSFGLRELLDVQGPRVIPSFAAFNLGVELGQAGFAVAVFATSTWVARGSRAAHRRLRFAIAVGSALVALLWTVERGRLLLA
jgi:hypothetical protein